MSYSEAMAKRWHSEDRKVKQVEPKREYKYKYVVNGACNRKVTLMTNVARSPKVREELADMILDQLSPFLFKEVTIKF